MTAEKRIILPKVYVPCIDSPLIFLAGPIRDAPDWQEKAIDYLLEKDKEIIIANPRWNASSYVKRNAVQGDNDHFLRQREWELHYLNIASQKGAVLFWLENAPGYMTRLELGQTMAQYRYSHARFCVGGDNNFSDIKTIEYDLSKFAPGKIIHSTLEETCQEAIKLANQKTQ